MNKSELIKAIAKNTKFTIKDSEKFLNSFIEVTTETLSEGEDIKLIGYGNLEIRHRKAREGRNPRNPEEVIQIPASKSVAFKVGKTLKDAINK